MYCFGCVFDCVLIDWLFALLFDCFGCLMCVCSVLVVLFDCFFVCLFEWWFVVCL